MRACLVTVVLISCLLVSGFSQNYIPFPDSGAVWVNTNYSVHVDPWNPMVQFELEGVEYFCVNGTDTTIGDFEYASVFQCDEDYFGGIRDSLGHIYFIPRDSTQEYTLYDFTVESGDSVFNVISYHNSEFNYFEVSDVLVGSVSTEIIAGVERKIVIAPARRWIEGIGSETGLFKETWQNISNFDNRLECFSINDEMVFPTQSNEHCSMNVGITDTQNSNPVISVFPNPTTSLFSLKFSKNQSGRLEVINSIGQVIKSFEIVNTQIKQISLPDRGFYHIRFIGDNFEQSFKVVKF